MRRFATWLSQRGLPAAEETARIGGGGEIGGDGLRLCTRRLSCCPAPPRLQSQLTADEECVTVDPRALCQIRWVEPEEL